MRVSTTENRSYFESLKFQSEQMYCIAELIPRLASLSASVLITGESGTGKECVARLLHTEGSRNRMPFVAINCGSIPDALLESELFGHEIGSFTGASVKKRD